MYRSTSGCRYTADLGVKPLTLDCENVIPYCPFKVVYVNTEYIQH